MAGQPDSAFFLRQKNVSETAEMNRKMLFSKRHSRVFQLFRRFCLIIFNFLSSEKTEKEKLCITLLQWNLPDVL